MRKLGGLGEARELDWGEEVLKPEVERDFGGTKGLREGVSRPEAEHDLGGVKGAGSREGASKSEVERKVRQNIGQKIVKLNDYRAERAAYDRDQVEWYCLNAFGDEHRVAQNRQRLRDRLMR